MNFIGTLPPDPCAEGKITLEGIFFGRLGNGIGFPISHPLDKHYATKALDKVLIDAKCRPSWM
jgi:hypothetical protein